jgi:hypothetical protein
MVIPRYGVILRERHTRLASRTTACARPKDLYAGRSAVPVATSRLTAGPVRQPRAPSVQILRSAHRAWSHVVSTGGAPPQNDSVRTRSGCSSEAAACHPEGAPHSTVPSHHRLRATEGSVRWALRGPGRDFPADGQFRPTASSAQRTDSSVGARPRYGTQARRGASLRMTARRRRPPADACPSARCHPGLRTTASDWTKSAKQSGAAQYIVSHQAGTAPDAAPDLPPPRSIAVRATELRLPSYPVCKPCASVGQSGIVLAVGPGTPAA